MAYQFRPDALADLVGSAPWSNYVGRPVRIVVEPEPIDKGRLKEIKAGSVRNSSSPAACYFELYIGVQSFEGGFIKSHLFSAFTIRKFLANSYSTTSAMVWTETKHFPARDEASVPAATQAIRDAFANNVKKFLEKKLGSKNPS